MVATLRRPSVTMGSLVLCLATLVASAAWADGGGHSSRPRAYAVTPLVSDGALPANFTDANLRNPWGIAFNPNGFVWVADNGSGRSTLYDGQGTPQSLVVTVPGAGAQPGKPTGIVFNGSGDFVVAKGSVQGPARFIFAGEGGTISGWAPNVDATNAQPVVDGSSLGSIYKGLALAATGTGNFLYATDFHNGRVDVFDRTFQRVNWPGAFADPALPHGFAPFGIQNVLGALVVTYAKQDAAAEDDVAGPGLGIVDVYDAQGRLLRRLATGRRLNAPWGIALAPADFGRFANALLIGNFGDGRISAFDPRDGEFLGQLRDATGKRIRIPGLWGLAFGNGIQQQPTGTLFFTAGPNDEADGLYGSIAPGTGGAADRDDD